MCAWVSRAPPPWSLIPSSNRCVGAASTYVSRVYTLSRCWMNGGVWASSQRQLCSLATAKEALDIISQHVLAAHCHVWDALYWLYLQTLLWAKKEGLKINSNFLLFPVIKSVWLLYRQHLFQIATENSFSVVSKMMEPQRFCVGEILPYSYMFAVTCCCIVSATTMLNLLLWLLLLLLL